MSTSKSVSKSVKPVVKPAANVLANTQVPPNSLTAQVQQAIANVVITPLVATPAARLAVMQASGLAVAGATALAHKVGSETLGKLPVGSLAVNNAKALTISKPGFNQNAWVAIVAAAPATAETLALAVQTATGCSGTVAAAHVRYRGKLGWLVNA